MWDYPLNNFELTFDDPEWVIGHGIGTGSLSSQYVAKVLGVPNPANDFGVENGYGMLILELGIPGVMLWMIWAMAFTMAAAQTVLKLGQTATFPLGLSAALYCCLLLFPFTWGGPAYQNYVSNAYFWMLAGLLFRLPGFETESAIDRAQEECQSADAQI